MPRVLAVLLVVLAALPCDAAAGAPVAATRSEAESLLVRPDLAVRDRQRALRTFARRASLDDLLLLLRHDAGRLAGVEAMLVSAALERVPDARASLKSQLLTRAAVLSPPRGAPPPSALLALRPRASVFRVALLLPTRGDYADFAGAVRAGVTTGLSWSRAPGAAPIETVSWSTGEDDPARAAAAMDSASHASAVVIGELLSVPTFAVAAAGRMTGTVVISPTATDESVGRTGSTTRQVGPTADERGRMLARRVVTRGQRVAVVAASRVARASFARTFLAEAESLGAVVVRRETYPEGGGDFRAIARSLRAAEAQVAFWDGEAREAEALVRALAMEKVRVRLCGGTALSPEQHHAPLRPLLEGVAWIAEDWVLESGAAAVADSLAHEQGIDDSSRSLWLRGFLAARALARAIDAGARTAHEVAVALDHPEAGARARGELSLLHFGARLPVWTAKRGRAVEWDDGR